MLHIDRPTLLVTHDAIVRVALLDIAQRPLTEFWSTRVENAAYAVVEVEGETWTLIEESVSMHLANQRASTESQAL
jgi:broad specificity phosphatase PhoE